MVAARRAEAAAVEIRRMAPPDPCRRAQHPEIEAPSADQPVNQPQGFAMYKIVRREVFSDTTFLWEVMVPDVAKSAQPGHFVMLRLHEGSERISR